MFKLQFKTKNAAFKDGPTVEIVRILQECAKLIKDGVRDGAVWDCNGYKIGSFHVDL